MIQNLHDYNNNYNLLLLNKKLINMKSLILSTALFVLFPMFVFSQSISVKYTETNELFINETKLEKGTKTSILQELIGEPSKITIDLSGQYQNHYYEDLGVVFICDKNGLYKMGINFNWRGDDKFPKTSYKGSLLLNNLEVNKDTTNQSIADLKENYGLECPMSLLCVTKDYTENVKCIADFESNSLTKVTFLMK